MVEPPLAVTIDSDSNQMYHPRCMIAEITHSLKEFKISLGIFVAFICLYLAILSVIGLHQPPWGDEEHFVQTIGQFGHGITLDLLRTYGEMSTPLPFVLYALWGKLFGFELPTLRILSLVTSFCTAILFWWLCYKIFHDGLSASVCTIFLFINPYMVGFSIFVFPDMVTILCLTVGILALVTHKTILLGIACAFGLLSRQYFIFFPLSVLIYCGYRLWRKDTSQWKTISAVLLGIIPTLILFWLWKGASPQNGLRDLYLAYAFKFHPTALILYVILLGAYLSPLIVVRWRKYYQSLSMAVIALVASLIYFLYPVKASLPSLANGINTVGYLHKAMSMILGPYVNLAFYGLFLLSLPILIHVIKTWFQNYKQPDIDWLIKLAMLLFLVIMPFSYLWWEKYFVLVLPLAILEIYRPISQTRV